MKNLENFGVVQISVRELQNLNGGQIPPWLKKLGWGAVIATVIDNWSDIKSGAYDAWTEN